MTVNGNSVQIPTGNDALSAIDTGTTLIGGPSDGVQNLYAAIPGSQPVGSQMQGFFAFRKSPPPPLPPSLQLTLDLMRPCGPACETTVTVSISFGGKSWPIDPDDMNLGQLGGGLCVGAIFDLGLGSNIGSGGGNPSWVVGDTFLVRPPPRISTSLHR